MGAKLFPLAWQGIRRRRRSSILLFLVLTLSFPVAVMMLSVMGSMDRTNEEYLRNTYGAWFGAIPDGRDEDRSFLERRDWLSQLGESVSYAQVKVSNPISGAGTVDETFLELGRIRLRSGRLPEQPGEIAMEEDLLTALGYSAELGQTVSVPLTIPLADAPDEWIRVDRSFTLTGVLNEYAHLWILEPNAQGRLLNSAIFLPEDGASIMEEAQARADSDQVGDVRQPVTSYFFTALPGTEEIAREAVDGYMDYSRLGGDGDHRGSYNVAAARRYSVTDYNAYYVALILVITLLAVVAVYLLELQSDVRRVVRLRSLGASKGQIRRLLLLETVLLALPALTLGTALGAAGTAVLLNLLVYSGSIAVILYIPWAMVAAAVALWVCGMALVRLLTFQAAVRTPMTGRMNLEARQRRRVHRLQRVFAWALSVALCAVATYSVMGIQFPLRLYLYTSSYPAYNVIASHYPDEQSLVAMEDIARMEEIPGISGWLGVTRLDGLIRGETLEEQPAQFFVVDALRWNVQKGKPIFDGIDLEAYNRGELAVLAVLNRRGTAYFTTQEERVDETGETYWEFLDHSVEITVQTGDSLSCTLPVSDRYLGGVETETGISFLSEDALTLPVTVGAVEGFGSGDTLESQNFGLPVGSNSPYSVFVSPGFVRRMLDALPDGGWLGPYEKDGLEGYTSLSLFTNLNAGALATDRGVLQAARAAGFGVLNHRLSLEPDIQGYLQTTLTLAASGTCIGLITALLLFSTLELEAQRERRRYGTLRALGMSRRQQDRDLLGRAALQAAAAVALGYAIYVAIAVRDSILNLHQNGEAVPALLQLLAWQLEDLRYTWFLPLLLLAEFLLVVALYFAAKGRLYKLNLMEMLSQER